MIFNNKRFITCMWTIFFPLRIKSKTWYIICCWSNIRKIHIWFISIILQLSIYFNMKTMSIISRTCHPSRIWSFSFISDQICGNYSCTNWRRHLYWLTWIITSSCSPIFFRSKIFRITCLVSCINYSISTPCNFIWLIFCMRKVLNYTIYCFWVINSIDNTNIIRPPHLRMIYNIIRWLSNQNLSWFIWIHNPLFIYNPSCWCKIWSPISIIISHFWDLGCSTF